VVKIGHLSEASRQRLTYRATATFRECFGQEPAKATLRHRRVAGMRNVRPVRLA
jgi:hypothetical protein